jgi:hypothetical protein
VTRFLCRRERSGITLNVSIIRVNNTNYEDNCFQFFIVN